MYVESRRLGLLTIISLVVAVAALALAGWTLYRSEYSKTEYDPAQIVATLRMTGGQYLMARLDPATPEHLAETVRDFANTLMDIGANTTAGAPNDDPAQAERLKKADAANDTITELCK